ncbi:glycosyl hydrolase [Lipomyces doorenjongii]
MALAFHCRCTVKCAGLDWCYRHVVLALTPQPHGDSHLAGNTQLLEYGPQFRFTPEKNWMNDPNGLVYHDGIYHIFYQYNPNGAKWGYISWGHAISTDLVHWKHLPIALECEVDANGNIMEMFFSGSAVPLSFCPPTSYGQVIREGQQSQSIAFSNDNGLTWTKYKGNPVIPSPPPVPRSTLESQFGPYNARFGEWECPSLFPLFVDGNTASEKWIMLIGINPGGVVAGSGTQSIIGSFDGKTFVADLSDDFESTSSTFEELGWTATGDFVCTGPRKASTVNAGKIKGCLGNGIMTTCLSGGTGTGTIASPKFTITEDYISFLVAGDYYPDNPVSMNLVVDGKVVHRWQRGILDCHRCQPLPSAHLHIDEIVFSNSPKDKANWNDFGPDYYAAATYNGMPNPEGTLVGWMNNWGYANDIPTSTWRSAMSIPRRLVQQPLSSVLTLYTAALYSHNFSALQCGETEVNVPALYDARMKLALKFARGTGTKFGVCLRSNATNTQETVIGYDFLGQNVFVDRFKSGNDSFACTRKRDCQLDRCLLSRGK